MSSGGNGGSTGAGGGTATGGGTGSDGGMSTNEPKAYRLSLAAKATPASCSVSGTASQFPATTLDVLTWRAGSAYFLALRNAPQLRLGNSPVISFPEAIEGDSATRFAFLRSAQTPISDSYTEARQVQALFEFSDLGASPTGTVEFSSQFACIRNRDNCPTSGPDYASCNLLVSFTATTIAIDPAWFRPTTEISGAQRFLSAWDVTPFTSISVPSCFRNSNLPAGQANVIEQNARSLLVLQRTANTLSLDGFELRLGEAPLIRPPADIVLNDGNFTWQGNVSTPSGTYTEVRQTSVSIADPLDGGTTASFASQYACVQGSGPCPTGSDAPIDAASCSEQTTFKAIAVP